MCVHMVGCVLSCVNAVSCWHVVAIGNYRASLRWVPARTLQAYVGNVWSDEAGTCSRLERRRSSSLHELRVVKRMPLMIRSSGDNPVVYYYMCVCEKPSFCLESCALRASVECWELLIHGRYLWSGQAGENRWQVILSAASNQLYMYRTVVHMQSNRTLAP